MTNNLFGNARGRLRPPPSHPRENAERGGREGDGVGADLPKRASARFQTIGNAARFGAGLVVALAVTAGAYAETIVITESVPENSPVLIETPMLASTVGDMLLPPVSQRVPQAPRIFFGSGRKSLGRHGGDWRMLVGRAKDTRLLNVYGYARLVCYDENYTFVTDILSQVEIKDYRVYTLTLREGHRWSDGHPFTSEDFRYYWQDVATNSMLAPTGPPRALLARGEEPRFEIIDEFTIRYSWSQPNPYFLPALASASPVFIYRPAHYLKGFHAAYTDPAKLEKLAAESGKRNWAALHNSVDNMYRFDNPDLPTLQPWVNTTRAPATRFVAKRNPYFHRIDAEGRQLPYIDRVLLDVADSKLIPAKTGAGVADLQTRGLFFNNYTFLKEGEARNDFSVRLWNTVRGSHLALYPNLNVNDPVWQKSVRDARFRRALSLAINRHEINQVIYFGLAIEGNNTVLPLSPLHEKNYRTDWAEFDIARANALLDELGLDQRDDDGLRLLPDGRPMRIIVETAGEDTEQTDVLELIHDTWKQAGIKLYTKPSQREVFRNRIFSGDTLMSIWSGYENGIPTADMSPEDFVPTSQQGYHWPKWGQYYETMGRSGEPVDLAPVKELVALNERWLDAMSPGERADVWREILEIHADKVFTIGLIAGVRQPVVVSNRLRNVPVEGVYNWEPGAQLGIYQPATFWFAPSDQSDVQSDVNRDVQRGVPGDLQNDPAG